MKEFQDRGRVGGVVDRRFGENDPSMSLEERMLERFTKERQRASKGTIFNLEGEEQLTHYGQSLSNLDDFDDVGLPMDEDEDDDQGEHSYVLFVCLFNSFKANLIVTSWGGHTLAGLAIKMRTKQNTMCVSLIA